MSTNKKFTLITIFLILFPNLIVLMSPIFENIFSDFYVTDYEKLFLGLVLISFVSSVYLLYYNYSSKTNNIFWYVLSGILAVILGFYFFISYTASNINF